MTDTNQSDFDTGRSIAEKLQAEVLETNPNTFFVKYGENDADIEPRTPLNEMLFGAADDIKDELYDLLVYGDPIEFTWRTTEMTRLSSFVSTGRGGTEHTLRVHSEDGGNLFELEFDDERVIVPTEERSTLLEILTDAGLGNMTRSRLKDLFDSINEDQVSRYTVEKFLDRFDTDRVRQGRQGWVIDDSFLVRYDGKNFLVDDPSSKVVRTDESHEFVDLDFDLTESRTVRTPDGEEVTLSAQEQQFLATVETFLRPEDYLGYDLSGRIIDNRRSGPAGDDIGKIASSVTDRGFRDPSIDSKVHGHSLEKHTLTASFDVTQEAIDKLHFAQNTHGAVNELARRESEFRRADFSVFHDTTNDDDERWREVKSQARSAPISDEAQRKMDSMFGSV